MDPTDEGAPMVDVVAPANLSGGFRFEAEINDRRFLATVPQGGVRKGETFSCYMKDLENTDTEIPIGRWRDGLFDCFKHGVFHPLLCNTIVCPLIALSQIMTRMGFDFLGRPAHDIPKKGIWSTRGMINTILSFWVFLNGVVLVGMNVKRSNGFDVSSADLTALVIVNLVMLCYLVYTTMATRLSLRARYIIRESRFYDMEDGLSAACCLPCTISQMGRHTASYEDHDGVCCNDTGLSNRLV
jgi:Cys-rich protein (TIGR01571 family)